MNDQTVKSFNKLFLEFLNKLSNVFPETEKIKQYILKYKMMIIVKETYFLKWYLEYIGPYSQYVYDDKVEDFILGYDIENAKDIMANDCERFDEESRQLTLAHILDSKENWTNGVITDKTKRAICDYIRTLYFIAINYKN